MIRFIKAHFGHKIGDETDQYTKGVENTLIDWGKAERVEVRTAEPKRTVRKKKTTRKKTKAE